MRADRAGRARIAPAWRSAGRFRPAGLGILISGALLLYVGLQFVRGGAHPLAATVGFDLCARLGPQPAAELPDWRAVPQRQIPGMGATRAATCYWAIDTDGRKAAVRSVWMVLITHQSLGAEGNRRGTRHFVDTFLDETRVSGRDVTPVNGPWKIGATIEQRSTSELQLLAEDDGVALWVSARGIERDALITLASAAARRLREKS